MTTAPDDFPHRLGPYRLEHLVGRGGMGVVYAAYDERLGRRVAVKRVLAADDDQRRRERLRREARTAAQLAHPATVQIFDFFEDADGDWIVMELVEGTPLSQLVAGGPLDVDPAIDYGRQIAEGLGAAHALGIVHRDLKTENVMVLPQGRIKILDFGLAKRLYPPDAGTEGREAPYPTLSEPGQVIGTGRAMSPEQARGMEVGPRSDLFSFGALLYEVLTGTSPFLGASFVETLQRVATHQPPPVTEVVPGVPRELSDLVDRLLRKAPELRPASARSIADALARLASERRFGAREPSGSLSSAATVTRFATEAAPAAAAWPPPGTDSGPGSGTRRLRAAVGLAALAASLAVIVAVLPPRLGSATRPSAGAAEDAPEETGESARPADFLRRYADGMRAVRRIDRPESVDRAVDVFLRLLERDSASAAAHAGLARAYWEKARNPSGGADPVFLEQAEAAARAAVRLDPYLADARVSLGLVELSRGRPEEARREQETALELDPDNADAHYGIAKLEESLRHAAAAEREYRRAVELSPTPMYLDALGALLYNGGRYSEAEQAFLESLELAPDDVHALRNLSGLYYARGRVDEAAAKLQEALKIRPDASLYSNLGTIFFSRGLYPKAAAAFESALGTDGASNRPVYWINLADAYRQMPDKEAEARTSYRRAIQLLGEAIAASPDDVRLLSRRALALARSGECGEALAEIARIRERGTGDDVYARFRLAVAEELCGQRGQALATLEEALRSGLALAETRREPDLLKLRADPRFHRLLMALDDKP